MRPTFHTWVTDLISEVPDSDAARPADNTAIAAFITEHFYVEGESRPAVDASSLESRLLSRDAQPSLGYGAINVNPAQNQIKADNSEVYSLKNQPCGTGYDLDKNKIKKLIEFMKLYRFDGQLHFNTDALGVLTRPVKPVDPRDERPVAPVDWEPTKLESGVKEKIRQNFWPPTTPLVQLVNLAEITTIPLLFWELDKNSEYTGLMYASFAAMLPGVLATIRNTHFYVSVTKVLRGDFLENLKKLMKKYQLETTKEGKKQIPPGLTLQPISRNGSCFSYAVGLCLNQDPTVLRNSVATYTETNIQAGAVLQLSGPISSVDLPENAPDPAGLRSTCIPNSRNPLSEERNEPFSSGSGHLRTRAGNVHETTLTTQSTPSSVSQPKIIGLSYEPTTGSGSGHCLFNAVAIYIGSDQATLRQVTAARIEHNMDEYEEIIHAIYSNITVGDYLQAVRTTECADDLEIAVLMKLLDRPIVIIGSQGEIRNKPNIEPYAGKEPIFVYYHGPHYEHYDGLSLQEGHTASEILTRLMGQSTARAEEVEVDAPDVKVNSCMSPRTEAELSDQINRSRVEIEAIQRTTNRPIIIIRSNGNPTMPDLRLYSGEPIFVYCDDHIHYDALLLQEGADARNILRNLQSTQPHKAQKSEKIDNAHTIRELGEQIDQFVYGLRTSEKYDLCVMAADSTLEKGKIYVGQKDGRLTYSLIGLDDKSALQNIETDIPLPADFTPENLQPLKDTILEVTSRAGHTHPVAPDSLLEELTAKLSNQGYYDPTMSHTREARVAKILLDRLTQSCFSDRILNNLSALSCYIIKLFDNAALFLQLFEDASIWVPLIFAFITGTIQGVDSGYNKYTAITGEHRSLFEMNAGFVPPAAADRAWLFSYCSNCPPIPWIMAKVGPAAWAYVKFRAIESFFRLTRFPNDQTTPGGLWGLRLIIILSAAFISCSFSIYDIDKKLAKLPTHRNFKYFDGNDKWFERALKVFIGALPVAAVAGYISYATGLNSLESGIVAAITEMMTAYLIASSEQFSEYYSWCAEFRFVESALNRMDGLHRYDRITMAILSTLGVVLGMYFNNPCLAAPAQALCFLCGTSALIGNSGTGWFSRSAVSAIRFVPGQTLLYSTQLINLLLNFAFPAYRLSHSQTTSDRPSTISEDVFYLSGCYLIIIAFVALGSITAYNKDWRATTAKTDLSYEIKPEYLHTSSYVVARSTFAKEKIKAVKDSAVAFFGRLMSDKNQDVGVNGDEDYSSIPNLD